MRSGLSMVVFTAFQVWNSMAFIWTAASTALGVGSSSKGGCPGYRDSGNRRAPGIAASMWRWKTGPPMPDGARTSETGRPFR